MTWNIIFHPDFEHEFDNLERPVQDAIYARLILLQREGPNLGRPHADTLNGSTYANMKELRCQVSGQHWRLAFAFDPEQKCVLLCAGSKSGVKSNRFYKTMNRIADRRFADHLSAGEGEKDEHDT
ncbi:MAG: type II toxin-antitoxin system RelE/ParE family toxin [Candidatus Puniceispirillales bacterium]